MLTSRYSRRISNITASNTVSVLATMLLLSYAKLLKTSIEVCLNNRLTIFDDQDTRLVKFVWARDGNILYFGQLHSLLFVMALLMLVLYIFPFTLFILLGPLLQSKSHYKFLNWVNKMKPFLDAYYGPYTRQYRCWPGLLLLVRLVGILSAYTPFNLVAVAVMVTVILLLWLFIGKVDHISLCQNKHLNYLELFFHVNLLIFSAISSYMYYRQVDKHVQKQQTLAVVMVGSVLVVVCCILAYRISSILCKCMKKCGVFRFIPAAKLTRRHGIEIVESSLQQSTRPDVTHSSVKILSPRIELREPLLTDS